MRDPYLSPERQGDIFGGSHAAPRPAKGGTTGSLIPREVEAKDDVRQMEQQLGRWKDAAGNGDAAGPAAPDSAGPATTPDAAQPKPFLADADPKLRARAVAAIERPASDGGAEKPYHRFIEEWVAAGGVPAVETERTSRKVRGERLENVREVPAIKMPDGSYFRLSSNAALDYARHVAAGGEKWADTAARGNAAAEAARGEEIDRQTVAAARSEEDALRRAAAKPFDRYMGQVEKDIRDAGVSGPAAERWRQDAREYHRRAVEKYAPVALSSSAEPGRDIPAAPADDDEPLLIDPGVLPDRGSDDDDSELELDFGEPTERPADDDDSELELDFGEPTEPTERPAPAPPRPRPTPAPPPPHPTEPPKQPDGPHDARLRRAMLDLAGGMEARRVWLKDLRKMFGDLSREEFDAAVRGLSRRGELTMYPLDDPRQIKPEDRAAAIESSTGVPQHIIYFGGHAS